MITFLIIYFIISLFKKPKRETKKEEIDDLEFDEINDILDED